MAGKRRKGWGRTKRKSKFSLPSPQRKPAPVTIRHDESIIKKATNATTK